MGFPEYVPAFFPGDVLEIFDPPPVWAVGEGADGVEVDEREVEGGDFADAFGLAA